MQGAHQLSIRVERQLAQTRVLVTVAALLHSQAVADHDERHLGRVTNGLSGFFVRGCIAGKQRGLEQQALHIIRKIKVLLIQQRPVCIDFLWCHFILGQCAGLIRADNRHRTQRLNRFQFLDNGILTRHFLRTHGLYDRDDRS